MKSFLPFCFLFAMQLNAQNLVPNGSFEQLTSCPQTWSGIDSCVGWFTEANSPDCLATCSPYPVSVPNNFPGSQLPFEGSNYAGLYPFVTTSGNFRETFGVKLSDSLIIGSTYHFSMRTCRAYNAGTSVVVACNHLGAKFSKFKHMFDNPFSLDNLQQLDEDTIITDSINWILLQWNYTADSSYKYVYIGNFHDDAHTDTLNASQPNTYAYYYVDSVNLYCVSASCATGISNDVNHNTLIEYDEGSGNLNFRLDRTETAEFFLVNIIGEKMIQMIVTDNLDLPLSSLPKGMYIAWLRTENGSLVKKISIH